MTIPLPQSMRMLDAAPAPVLDRERRPTVDNSGVGAAAAAIGNIRLPEANGNAFAAPFEALGSVGRAIGQAGSILGGLAIKRREAETDVQVSEGAAKVDAAFADFENWKMSEPDPGKWEAKWSEKFAEVKESVSGVEGLHPAAAARLQQHLTEYDGKTRISVARDATKQTFQLAASSSDAAVTRALSMKDYDSALRIQKEAESKGYSYPHQTAELEARIPQFRERDEKERKATAAQASQDSVIQSVEAWGLEETMKSLNTPGFGADWGATPSDLEGLRNTAQAVARDRRAGDAERVSDMMAKGEIQTTAQLDALESVHLTPSDRAEMRSLLEKRQSAEYKARLNDPAYQDKLYGSLLARAKAWKPDGTDAATDEYLSILRDADGLNVATIKNDITEPLARKRTEKPTPPDAVLKDYVSERLTRLHERGLMGAVPVDENGKMTHAKEGDAAARKLARTSRLMNEWLSRNPKATEEQADEQALKIIGGNLDADAARAIMGETLNPTPAQMSAELGLTKETPASGKVTSYGYSSDPHADSYSAMAVGSFSGAEAEAAAKAGKYHPLKLKKGDMAVSPDVEEQFRADGIEPGDIVRVTMANGKQKTVRWMDRTANDKQAAERGLPPLRGRFDFYSPDGPHPDDGVGVVSFAKVPKPKK